ncbi:MAG TPA: GNAT family N-acetyltransferase [Thermoanaerobaculia bacterium]|nr:GNAT family N-acetyltransferase [Thermoanaerobaculia bacterium]
MTDRVPPKFRDATRHDIPAIISFQLAMASETEDVELDRYVCARGVEAVFEDRSLGRYFIVESNGQVIASLLITYEWSDWRNGVVWWIQSVYVAPESRRSGVYSGLYQYVKRLAVADEKVRGIRLYVDRRNRAAQDTYRNLGMDGEHYQVFEWMRP